MAFRAALELDVIWVPEFSLAGWLVDVTDLFTGRDLEDFLPGPPVTTADEEATRHLFGSGRAIYMRNWPYAWTIFQREGSKVRGKVGVAPMPRFPGLMEASTLGGWQPGINRFSRKVEVVKRFVKFLTSPESQRAFALHSGFKPSRRSVYFDEALEEAQPFTVRLLSLMEQTIPCPVTPFYPMISHIL